MPRAGRGDRRRRRAILVFSPASRARSASSLEGIDRPAAGGDGPWTKRVGHEHNRAAGWLNGSVSGVFHSDEESYDEFMGRYSVRLAPLFADFAGVAEGLRVLDVGAGTGALTRELVARGAVVVAVEPSPTFTRALRSRFPQMEVHEAPAEELPFADQSFDIALAQLVVAFVEDAHAAMRELGRVAHRVAICMWGVEEVQMFAAIGRTARVIGFGSTEQGARRYRTSQELHDLLVEAGLTSVETCELDVTAAYADFAEFWRALSLQVGPAGAWLHSLDDSQRALAHDELHRQLGSPNGPFELHGRAYGARATGQAALSHGASRRCFGIPKHRRGCVTRKYRRGYVTRVSSGRATPRNAKRERKPNANPPPRDHQPLNPTAPRPCHPRVTRSGD